MVPISLIATLVTVAASLGAIVLVVVLVRHAVISRRTDAVSKIDEAVPPALTWQERAAAYEDSGEYADYPCPYVHRVNAGDDVDEPKG